MGLVIVLVVAASLAGLFRPALCLIDSAGCVALPEPGATPTSAVELPAASDELAVSVTAGRSAVPPGRHDSAAGTEAVTSLGRVPSLRALWSGAPESEGMFEGTAPLVPLSDMSCGTEQTGPCDVWEGLSADVAAEQTSGASRLSLLGLDTVSGTPEDMAAVDLVVPAGPRSRLEGVDEILYRNVLRISDGATTESWTWTDPQGGVRHVRADRGGEGTVQAVTVVFSMADEDGAVTWTTLTIAATETSRDALEEWLAQVRSQQAPLGEDDLNLTTIDAVGNEAFWRLAWSTGVITRETLTLPEGATLSAELVRDDPGHASASVTTTEILGPPDEDGTRTFVQQGES